MSNEFRLIQSTYRGCSLLVHRDYIFQKNYTNQDQSINWRCQNNRLKGQSKCPATCRTKDGKFIREPSEHNHPPEKATKIQMHECVQNIKENIHDIKKGVKRYFEEAINESIANNNRPVEEYIDDIPKFNSYRTYLYRIKHESIPKLPKTIPEIDLSMEKYKLTKDGRRFLLLQTDEFIIFSSKLQLEMLATAERWHIDGTFSASPKLFYQVYTIHAWLYSEMHVAAFMLLKNKTQVTYSDAFNKLKSCAINEEFNLKPREVISDFELAAINALREVFPGVVIKGCHFHFCQALKKNIKSIGKFYILIIWLYLYFTYFNILNIPGLESVYQKNEVLQDWLKIFMIFAMVPPSNINYVWQYQINTKPTINEQQKIDEFLNYFYNQWLNNRTLAISDWNHFDNSVPRTNNHVEGFNRKLGEYVVCDHPHIYSLTETFKELEMSCIINFLQRKNGHLPQSQRRIIDVNRDKRISNLKTALNNNQISILDYCRSLRFLYSLKVNKENDEEENKSRNVISNFNLEEYNVEIDKAFIQFETKTLNNISISSHDIQTLSPKQWLNDTIIDYYFNLLLLEYSDYFCFSTYFYNSLSRNNLNTVTKWYKKFNIFSYKKIFIPILENHHWILVVLDTEVCRLVLYDSLSRSYNHILEKLQLFFLNMYKIYYLTEPSFTFFTTHASLLPLQKNSYDCGVYICKFAEFICKKRDFTFCDNDMLRYRRKIVLSILRNKVL